MLLKEHIPQEVTITAQSDHELDHSIGTKCALHLYVLSCSLFMPSVHVRGPWTEAMPAQHEMTC
jgi:hypothetical protein